MNDQAQGVALDDAGPPEWLHAYVSPAQLRLSPGLLWIVAMYTSSTLGKAEMNVAQRLHIACEGQDRKQRKMSHAELAGDTKQAPQTNMSAIKRLKAQGWLLVKRVNNHENRYRLAWPTRDVLAEPKRTISRCGEQTTKDATCNRRAGWGTDHRGHGRCKLHDAPAPLQPQQLEPEKEESGSPELQPLESDDASDADPERASTPILEAFNSNHWGFQLQPLERPTPTIGDLYVGTTGTQKQVRKRSRVLSAGELTVRTARAADTPPANHSRSPDDIARRIINAIPRYATATGWVRRLLAAAIVEALNAAYGPDAIRRYARMVVDEQRYAEHQHTLELADALKRLARDHRLGDACPDCGLPECDCRAPVVEIDPDAEIDPAVLARHYARHGVNPADLAELPEEVAA